MKNLLKSMMFAALGVFALSSCEDVPAPYAVPGVGGSELPELELTGEGTFEAPYTVADALALISRNAYSSSEVYVEGVITQVGIEKDGELTDLPGTSFGNATYFIADTDESGAPQGTELEVYRGKGLDGENMSTADYIKVGDKVIIYGVLTKFGSTPEITQGSKLMKLNDKIVTPPDYSGAKGSGTLEDPYNPIAALQVCSTLEKSTSSNSHPTDNVYIRGKVTRIDDSGNNAFNPQFGNITYYISEEGTTEEMELLIYRGKGLGGKAFMTQDDIKPGDDVLVLGQLVNFNGTYEVTTGSQLAEHNGDTPKEPNHGEAEGDGTEASPFNVAGVNAFIDSGNYAGKEVYFTGIVSSIKEISTQYGNATFYISDDGATDSEQFYVFRIKSFNGADFTSANALKVGDVVVVRSTVTLYQGNTKETEANKGVLVSVNGKTETEETPDNPDNPDDQGSSEGISVDGNTITLTNAAVAPVAGSNGFTTDLATLGLNNATDVNEKEFNLNDGSTIVFGKGTGKNPPMYYEATTQGVRMYANNTLTIKHPRMTIAQVVLECEAPSNGKNYVGNGTKTVIFNADGVVLTNTLTTGNSGGDQLRVKTITVFYAE